MSYLCQFLALAEPSPQYSFIEACEVSAQHDEVCAHCQCQRHVVIVNDAAVGTDGDINTGFLVVIVSCLCNLDDSRGLSTADPLLLTGNADRTAADADFYKVCAAVCQETEALCIYYVACANLYGVAVGFTNPFQCILLPFAVALGGVDAQDVYACLYQSRYSFLKVSCVDACADNITLAGIQKLVLVYLVS